MEWNGWKERHTLRWFGYNERKKSEVLKKVYVSKIAGLKEERKASCKMEG